MVIRREISRGSKAEARAAKMRERRRSGYMPRNLDHLPVGKRAELAMVTEVLTSSFAQEISTRWAARLKNGRILKIVLFGSYARGDWVEDPVGRYFSDYDLLVVVADEAHADVLEFWETAEKRLLDALASGERLRTPVNFIVHSLEDVNDQLTHGRYFFIDILREGIELFGAPDAPAFVEPLSLTQAAALSEAKDSFEEWIESADNALLGADFYAASGKDKDAAFLLHQAVERLYNCLLLVTTLYTPKSHNLVRLRNLADRIDPRLVEVWPTGTKAEKRGFELLKQAYVKARYSKRYRVTPEELSWMRERIERLRERVIAVCEAHLASLAGSTGLASAGRGTSDGEVPLLKAP